jgi:hypothetical protein
MNLKAYLTKKLKLKLKTGRLGQSTKRGLVTVQPVEEKKGKQKKITKYRI